MTKKGYKIVEEGSDGRFRTLFHGVARSRLLEMGKWYTADVKMVKDGSSVTQYLSGFHFFPSETDCEEYLKKFNHESRKLAIVSVEVKTGIRQKVTNPAVYLANCLKVVGLRENSL